MNVEEKIRTHLKSLKARTEKLKTSVDETFYADIVKDGTIVDQEKLDSFFQLVTMKIAGREVRAYRGFIDLGLRAIKRHGPEIVAAAKSGAEFAKGVK